MPSTRNSNKSANASPPVQREPKRERTPATTRKLPSSIKKLRRETREARRRSSANRAAKLLGLSDKEFDKMCAEFDSPSPPESPSMTSASASPRMTSPENRAMTPATNAAASEGSRKLTPEAAKESPKYIPGSPKYSPDSPQYSTRSRSARQMSPQYRPMVRARSPSGSPLPSPSASPRTYPKTHVVPGTLRQVTSRLPAEDKAGARMASPLLHLERTSSSIPPCPVSPKSAWKEERLEAMEMALQKLDFHVERRTAAWKRENGDYFEGDTPKTSQESNNSQYRYSQDSVADVVELGPLIDFAMEYVSIDGIHAVVRQTVGMSREDAEKDPAVFKAALAALLNEEPAACLEVLERAVRAARSEAEEGRVRAMLRGALP
jgi:hypothetical protein